MKIGYACLTIGVPDTNFKSCLLKNASENNLYELIYHNLNALENIIDYNIQNQLLLFRITSGLIPFAGTSANTLAWPDIFADRLAQIGEKIKSSGMRVSMHPGQYTVLNSPDPQVVKNAISDLDYHAQVLDSLGLDRQHKIVLHIGGIYNDKVAAQERFISNYHHLPETVKRRLILENDDRLYHIGDVLDIAARINLPVVYDNLHNQTNPCEGKTDNCKWINHCRNTWGKKDGPQKMHYSQQDPQKKPGSHSGTIRIKEFMELYEHLGRTDLDIMLEVKDKNLSAVKCNNCVSTAKTIKTLETEWSRYKYKVLENSPSDYTEIRTLLKNKNQYPAVSFYSLIEQALQKEIHPGQAINAAQHIWGYFKNTASEKEKSSFAKLLAEYNQGQTRLQTIKNFLWKMTLKYNQPYLRDSYYFILSL